jgi:hypothetical protein
MSLIDPATGKPLPNDAIQRVLFICHPVHVYGIPPLMSMKGYTAADWTTPDPRNGGKTMQIFTARLRILETATPFTVPGTDQEHEQVKTDIVLEDPSTGTLFAAAPYTDESAVEHAVDSSRFFALRVVGEGGRKAMLGIGFEDRSEAFDFGVTLQEARKVLGLGTRASEESAPTAAGAAGSLPKRGAMQPRGVPAGAGGPRGIAVRPVGGRMAVAGTVGSRSSPQRQPSSPAEPPPPPKDYSLKPGQTITVNLGGRRPAPPAGSPNTPSRSTSQDETSALFSIPPPPGSSSASQTKDKDTDSFGGFSLIPPPPSAREARADRRRNPPTGAVEVDLPQPPTSSVHDNPPDDDDFGDFQ